MKSLLYCATLAVSIASASLPLCAKELTEGDVIITDGLLCNESSEVEAVATLVAGGHPLTSAILDVNVGAESAPRCALGLKMLTEYRGREKRFVAGRFEFTIHRVRILGIETASGLARFKETFEQFGVSIRILKLDPA